MIPRTVLIATRALRRGAERRARGGGDRAGGAGGRPLVGGRFVPDRKPPCREDFDARMRAARAVVVGAERLDESTLLGSTVFEIATRARQAGVPAYAVTAENALSRFDARILDLQVILEARDTRSLRRAGEQLASAQVVLERSVRKHCPSPR